MKKISVKQLLVNAMKEYGYNLILSDRIWYLINIGPYGRLLYKPQHIPHILEVFHYEEHYDP